MRYLTVDFGSTYTKLTLVDADQKRVVGTAAAFTTIETDVMEGFRNAFRLLGERVEDASYDQLVCCSSAAGGLKMVALGLVPSLTAKAAKLAASSAGAKVVKTYSYEISKSEQEEIYQINPDLILLCGGTDGGNKEVILANAQRLADIDRPFSIIVAGNKIASYEIEEILKASNKRYVITENVMPDFNHLNIAPAKQCIMDLFISRIIEAKGLGKAQAMTDYKIIPTPLAVFYACELLSLGTSKSPGWGDLIAVDLGGATTDIYSIADGAPSMDNVMIKGIPEPRSKRSVEGDLGMRYSLQSLLDETAVEPLSDELGISAEEIVSWVEQCSLIPSLLPESEQQQKIEEGMAKSAVDIAVERHAGILKSLYTPMGEVFTLNGKDLTKIPRVIGIGGAILNSADPRYILSGAKFRPDRFEYAKPKDPMLMWDKKYIMASMGLISQIDKELALSIMKEEIVEIKK